MKFVVVILAAIGLCILSAIVFGTVLMMIWNGIVPDIFGLPKITLLQAWGLFLIVRLLIDGKITANYKER